MSLQSLYRHQQLAARRDAVNLRDLLRRSDRTSGHPMYDEPIRQAQVDFDKHSRNTNRLMGLLAASRNES